MIVCREVKNHLDIRCSGLESHDRCLSFGDGIRIIWCINHSFRHNPYYTNKMFWVNKEKFIDWLSDKYPDHLEWLLFHPEWFEGRND